MRLTRLQSAIREFRLNTLRPLRARIAARARKRASGVFIGVTGSSGKSTTTALIASILVRKGKVHAQVMANTINPLIKTVMQNPDADYVVVEAGVGGKGQMREMMSVLRPDIAVVTMVGLEHYSAFRSAEAIAEEKGELVAATGADGLVVLNADDPLVMGMRARTSARVVTFGRHADADLHILGVTSSATTGVTVAFRWKDTHFEVPTRFVGEHFAMPVAAATAVALALGVEPKTIQEAIGTQEPLALRLSPHALPAGPVFLADSAKAPFGTLTLAFDALRAFPAKRRRIVLGAISDYRGDRKRAYRFALAAALDSADEVILVTEIGQPGRLAPDAFNAGRLVVFSDTREAAKYISDTAIEGEAILLKGSANYHIERVMLNMTDTVRCWEFTCGRAESCLNCGMFRSEHRFHRSLRRKRRWARLLPFSRAPDQDRPLT